MKLTSQEKLTVKTYNENAAEWEKEHSDISYQEEKKGAKDYCH